jgi:hypothetical protein
MTFEEAKERADYMIEALGLSWTADLKDTHGWRCSVKNGPCIVTFNENSRDYQALIQLGPTFSAYSTGPVTALQLAVDKFDTYLNRINAERRAIDNVLMGFSYATGLEEKR